MRIIIIPLLALTLTGCAQKMIAANSPSAITGYRHASPSRVVEAFRFVDASTSPKNLIARIGPPDAVITVSPGFSDLMQYNLYDDTSVMIETDAASRILKVKHGQTVLFEQPR